MQKLLIIDGNAIIHRAFHAFPQLTSHNGQPVNAVYGFYAILIKSLELVKPSHLTICFDKPTPTFRKLMYAGYQAHRPKMVDGLSEQMGILQKSITQIGIPIYSRDGYEADDVIGTIAYQSLLQESEVVILTGDRDLLQLVNSKVTILAPIVGISKYIIFDEQTVLEKYGIKPTQVIDYKALVGDSSDGYPGVTGIGPKTAVNLLKCYGSFENLYKKINNLPEKIAIKLATDAEQAALAKKLATIDLNVPVSIDLPKCDMKNFSRSKIEDVFDTFSFSSLKKRLSIFNQFQQDTGFDQKSETLKTDQLPLI